MDLKQILNDIEPPPGGLFTLRKRMRRRAQIRYRLRILWSVVAALVLSVWIAWPGNPTPARERIDLLANGGSVALGTGTADRSITVASPDASGAFVPVITEGDVLFYELVSF